VPPATGVRIVRAGVDRLPEVEPLARALHRHHLTVDPAIPGVPPRDEDGWWRVRSARYRGWLTDPATILLLAEHEGGVAVGYALVTVHDEDDSHRTGARFAELQSLAVPEDRRGEGIGTALLHQVYREVRAVGITEMVIGVLATNAAAMRLYEREGFRPWVVLTMGTVPDPDA
jgi:ribosomal protein S18 acetylase RimI-like enzyme